ncbi:unnamed protein product [Wuchereria bancrofti]|uniref:Uncharacterized protein n=1 Tax=Wuchereria bancrofti TaxID=6293 RepID=A0A3P7FMY6_WUCBA|nr:unnamed protein product [Wuchereria bancrofti]
MQARQEHLVKLDQMDQKDHQEMQALMDHLENLDLTVTGDQMVKLDLKVPVMLVHLQGQHLVIKFIT